MPGTNQRPAPVLRQPVKKGQNATYLATLESVKRAARRLIQDPKDGSDLFAAPAGTPRSGEPIVTVSLTKQGSVLVGVAQSVVDSNETLRGLPWGSPYRLAGFANQPAFLPLVEIADGTNRDLSRMEQAIEKVVETALGPDGEDLLDAILAL